MITDAMDMGGLAAHFDAGEAAVRAIEAGVDQILFSVDTDAAIAAVKEAVRSGRVSIARIDEAVERVMQAKRRHRAPGLWDFSADGSRKPENPRSLKPDADFIADRAVKIVRDTNTLLPLRTTRLAVAIVNPHNDAIDLGLESNADPEDAEVLVLALVIRPKSGAGTISVPEDIRRLAQRHAHKTIAISFGSPYILGELGDVSTFVCAWGPQPVMQRAALRAIGAK